MDEFISVCYVETFFFYEVSDGLGNDLKDFKVFVPVILFFARFFFFF